VTSSHAAYNVTVDVTTHSARISWYPAYDAGHPLHYVIWWVPSGTCCWIFLSKRELIRLVFWRIILNSSRPLMTGVIWICHYWQYCFPSVGEIFPRPLVRWPTRLVITFIQTSSHHNYITPRLVVLWLRCDCSIVVVWARLAEVCSVLWHGNISPTSRKQCMLHVHVYRQYRPTWKLRTDRQTDKRTTFSGSTSCKFTAVIVVSHG